MVHVSCARSKYVSSFYIIEHQTVVYVSDPVQWSAEDVKAWLVFNLQQYGMAMAVVEHFNMDGSVLAQLSEEEFQQRAPQVGFSLTSTFKVTFT